LGSGSRGTARSSSGVGNRRRRKGLEEAVTLTPRRCRYPGLRARPHVPTMGRASPIEAQLAVWNRAKAMSTASRPTTKPRPSSRVRAQIFGGR
jgi:hypothetical protein